jgi:hypothetical protein
MREYRAYILRADGHRFVKVKEFSSNQPDDAAAISAAKKLIDDHDVELWDRGRLIARFSSSGEVVSPALAPFTLSTTAPQSNDSAGYPVASRS